MKKHRNQKVRVAVCITDSEPDLEPGKIYQVLPDGPAVKENCLRVVDESGEHYLYPASFFILIELPQEIERVLGVRLRKRKSVSRALHRAT